MDRREFLTQSLALGCSLAASPLATPVSFAATPGDARLVVIILRGGMDGLATLAPYGDAGFAQLRGAPEFGPKGYHDLDGFFALHPALSRLMPLWKAGEFGAVHAVSTPYRDKRSHFDGQDLLEAGMASLDMPGARSGWLNRLLDVLPGAQMDTAWAVGREQLAILSGRADVSRWAPENDLALSPQALLLARQVMATDPAMGAAFEEALRVAGSDGDAVELLPGQDPNSVMMGATDGGPARRIAEFVGTRLREDARIAAFSLNGWDTHARQAKTLPRALNALTNALLTLQNSLGAQVWQRTAVLAMTEFGRTARMNGSAGTDHGTGGAMIFAGGALRGGQVLGHWPGLSEPALYDRRDLMPVRDLRAYIGWALRGLYGISASEIESTVFPGLSLGDNPGLTQA